MPDIQKKSYITNKWIILVILPPYGQYVKKYIFRFSVFCNISWVFKKIKQIKKETPFYTYIDTKEIYNTEKSENILVQGIIDLYYINDNDEVVLIDYKTDYVEKEYELIEKYKVQLEIYKKALEESLNTKINEIYIYSIWLNKEVKIEEI